MAKNFYLDRGNIFSRLMFVSATSPLVLCVYKLVLNLFCLLYFFLARQDSGRFNESAFVLPVVCTNEKYQLHAQY